MKTRVEKFLVQLEMQEPDDAAGQLGTRWKGSPEDFRRMLETSANTWAVGLTYGPRPDVTVSVEEAKP